MFGERRHGYVHVGLSATAVPQPHHTAGGSHFLEVWLPSKAEISKIMHGMSIELLFK
jgi:hypothetical protein